MLFVLSPAKSLDFAVAPDTLGHSQPQFVAQAAELIELLRAQSPSEIASLMSLSDALAGLNVARYAAWRPKFSAKNSKQAVMAFNGDVYQGLDAATLDAPALHWLQQQVCILSGLYGVLRPLDWMQPYRLEMGSKLANAHGANLYKFWGTQLASYLNTRFKGEATPVLVNLASQEYFKAVDLKTLNARVIDCVFEEWRGDRYKIVSLYAKRARGLMARYAATQQVTTPAQLKGFDVEGYAFERGASEPNRLVFRRHSNL